MRRSLIAGTITVISGTKIKPPPENPELGRMLARKSLMLSAIALANEILCKYLRWTLYIKYAIA